MAVRKDEFGSIEYAEYLLRARREFERGRAATLAELRAVYRRTAEAIRRDIESVTPGTLRHGHLAALASNLENRAKELNRQVLDATQRGIWLSSSAGVRGPASIAEEVLREAFDPPEVRRLFAGINERAVLAMLSRTRKDGLKLSDRVWRVGEKARAAVTRLVEDGVARELDSRVLARKVQRYLQPGVWTAHKLETRRRLGVSKDVSYEAMRLARTEMNNAFHEGMIAANQEVPSYRGIYWRLSGSHPAPDVCDDMATNTSYGEPGFYPKGYEPIRPHPQCFCVTVPAYEDPRQFTERLREWGQNPSSQPDIEEWYNGTARQFLRRPASLRIVEPMRLAEGIYLTVKAKESEIRRLRYEKAYVFDDDGRMILAKDGEETHVAFTRDEVMQFTGRTLTHNHPSGGSFSLDDINLAVSHDLREIRVVGGEYTHVMRPGKKGWPTLNKLASAYDDADHEVGEELWRETLLGKMIPEQANKEHHHRVWLRVAQKLGLYYRRE